MLIIPSPLENKVIIKNMAIDDINNMIEALQKLKIEAENNINLYGAACENHIPTEIQKKGVVGIHHQEGMLSAESSFTHIDQWTNKKQTIKFVSLNTKTQVDIELLRDLNVGFSSGVIPEQDCESMDDEIVYDLRSGLLVLNMSKVACLIKKTYLADDNDFCFADFTYFAGGGVFVANVVNRYFLVENNMTGLGITEIHKNFYDAFCEEFKWGKK